MEKLGIDLFGLLAQIVNFVIIIWVLRKFLYGPVLKVLHERKAKVEKSLEDVKNIEERLVKVEDAVKQKINEAGQEADKIIKEAKKTAKQIQEQVEQKAEDQAHKILIQADERIKQKEKELMNQVKSQVKDLAILMVEKSLGNINEKTKNLITKDALEKAVNTIQK